MPEPASEPAYGEQNEALEPGVDRVLVIDDDRELCELVREYLVQECFYVDLIHEGRHGLEQALSGKYDVVILDVMLPGMNGLQVLQAIRRASRVGVLMLTARGEDVDRILGLEHGADDYLAKPFNPRELVARIRAVLRRLRPAGASDGLWSPERLELGDLHLDQGFSPFDRSIDVHISNLRKKLGLLPEGVERIRSDRNVGYLYAQQLRHT